MAPKQRMRIANEKASKWVTMRGNVPKSSVSWERNYRVFVCEFVIECILHFTSELN